MEKVKLNNQIVSMRKYVKQAKVHVINKLVKQIKLLQNRKGNEIQIQKAKRKAERFLEAVTLIKKIKPDDVSKLALSKVKDWKTVLSEKNSSVYDRCIAMLANYGAVQKEVESFYCANKELILKISDYIAQWEEKSKLPKDSPKTNSKSFIKKASENLSLEKSKKQELAGIKKSKLKTVVETESKPNKNNVVSELSNNAENINLSAEKVNISIDEVLTVENSNNNRKPVRIKERKESHENNSMSDEETNSNEESPSNGNDSDKEIKNNVLNNSNEEDENSSDEESNVDGTYKSVSNSNSPIKIDKSKNKLKAIALLNLNELEGLDEIPVSNSFKNDESDEHASSEDGLSDTSQDKNIDPFFLGHNKDDFNSNIQDDSSKDSDTDMRAKGSSNNFKSEIQGVKKPFYHQKNYQFSHKKSFQRSLYNQKNDSKPFKRNTENSFNRNHKTEKQNSFVRRDYNKTFERGNLNKNRKDFKLKDKPFPSHDSFHKKPFPKNIPKSYGSKQDSSFKQKNSFKKGNISESLHPSWEAKRKQKELLSTSFQGKRIVFDD